jgi:hypothetical protein
MGNIESIKHAIESLSESDYAELRRWFADKEWAEWDKEFEEDVVAGRLDFLKEEALEEKRKGLLKEL